VCSATVFTVASVKSMPEQMVWPLLAPPEVSYGQIWVVET
jgi:hypothetical protein